MSAKRDEDILEDGETVNVGADSDLELEIVNDEPEVPSEPEGDEEELASYSKNVKKRIAQLTYKAREAERDRERLERQQAALADYTKRTMAENQALKKALNNGQSLIADQLKGRVTSDLALAEKKLKVMEHHKLLQLN
jgi:molecular chaperone GrpE (heat shock protein)